ncbi:Metallo-dependent hydrolase [Microthyrium microscopicum]|uniref:Metallo-dependent hydrolase n=1 Tax=Microthyrium microscopicum TaxID=703497 RepID=A0A6A6UB49_9PEZI|nr:Metallo-dependent hydrolase [Microthyrium microscopicum]
MGDNKDADAFPWHLGVFDAHCHPTDINASIAKIPDMKAQTLALMATRGEDQEMVHEAAQNLGPKGTTLDKNVRVLPSFGWHPWMAHLLFDDTQFDGRTTLTQDERRKHFDSVLTPAPSDDSFVKAPEELVALSTYLGQQREYLLQHPLAMVGEVGIDRRFRIPTPWTAEEFQKRTMLRTGGSREGRGLSPQSVSMEHQLKVLEAQVRLAGELERPVSVHGVQAHGALFDFFNKLWKGHEIESKTKAKRRRAEALEAKNVAAQKDDDSPPATEETKADTQTTTKPFPPRICLHSYSGPATNLKQYFKYTVPSKVYVSFCMEINFATNGGVSKAEECIKFLPADRILIESDLHRAGPEMDQKLEEIARKICDLRGWSLEEGVKILGENWKSFVLGSTDKQQEK